MLKKRVGAPILFFASNPIGRWEKHTTDPTTRTTVHAHLFSWGSFRKDLHTTRRNTDVEKRSRAARSAIAYGKFERLAETKRILVRIRADISNMLHKDADVDISNM